MKHMNHGFQDWPCLQAGEWREYHDKEHGGKAYYHNARTGQTQWEKPASFHAAEESAVFFLF